jgi:glutamate-1-semialdehyde 2,1-aminomutase
VIKVEGCYHGHHDSVQVSVQPGAGEVGPAERPHPVAGSTGIPRAIRDLTLVTAFNSLDGAARLLEEHPGQVAGMIIEPVMMNAGIVPPLPGYLEGLRDVLHEHGAVLTFDEVKTGLTAGPGGAARRYGVTPDLVCLAKAFGGGLVAGAIGGTEDLMGRVARGEYEMVGTFNGNPLSMAAARAMLLDVATPAAHEHVEQLNVKVQRELEDEIRARSLPAHVVAVGAKGCVTFSRRRVRDYRDFLLVDDRYNHAHWLFQHNGGVFLPPWGKTEQWMISVQHSTPDMDQFVENFRRFAAAVAP